jgi:hypothetical protein
VQHDIKITLYNILSELQHDVALKHAGIHDDLKDKQTHVTLAISSVFRRNGISGHKLTETVQREVGYRVTPVKKRIRVRN